MTPPRVAILAEGLFDRAHAKTAIGVMRYGPYPVVAVVDSVHAGSDALDVVGDGSGVPVVATIDEARALGAGVLLLGTAAAGGRIPDGYRPLLAAALESGMEVWNGMHERVRADPVLAAAAERGGAVVRELREPPADLEVGGLRRRRAGSRIVLTVGSDAAVGKMTTSLELVRALERRGARAAFVATGQTGIAIAGGGIAVDAVVADFIAGAAERLSCDAAERADWVVVEGQGSLFHPGFSGVTLGLLHGAAPDLMVLCHEVSRRTVKEHDDLPLRPLPEIVRIYEDAASWSRHPSARRARVRAVALNTFGLSDSESREAVERTRAETGLVTADPLRHRGADALAETLLTSE